VSEPWIHELSAAPVASQVKAQGRTGAVVGLLANLTWPLWRGVSAAAWRLWFITLARYLGWPVCSAHPTLVEGAVSLQFCV
jgi:hypothetical protein